jgi:hypothetical protein
MYGISIYPYKEPEPVTANYIDMAAGYGFGRVFTSLLLTDKNNKDESLMQIGKALKLCRLRNMEVVLDVSPHVFKELGLTYADLSFFRELGATALRLDETFDGGAEALMTYNREGLDIEINISNNTFYADNILAYRPYRQRLIGCHNFYPQRYTGLDFDYFIECSRHFKKLGLRTAAFISSPHAHNGPHSFTDGLCTLEMHRDLPMLTQAKHYIALNSLIDDIIIANSFADESELKALSLLPQDQLVLDVEASKKNSPIENEILFGNQHVVRGDINSYSHRSTAVRILYKTADIPPHDTESRLEPGDITLGNNKFGQYKAELGIVKKAFPNKEGLKNVAARISEEELFLLDYLKPWSKFRLRTKHGHDS